MKRATYLAILAVLLAPLLLGGCASFQGAQAAPGKLLVVGAENFYADILHQIGGNRVQVYAVIKSPAADPHEYEATSRDAIAVAGARIVVMNGLGYDAWMEHLLAGSPNSRRLVVVAGDVAHIQLGANPHVWYDVRLMERVASVVAHDLARLDPAHREYFAARQRSFAGSLLPVLRKIASLRERAAGTRVVETEPVFRYMLGSLHFAVPSGNFQRAVEEGTSPPAGQIVAFESLLRDRSVRALIYNQQAVEPITQLMAGIARQHAVPVVAVTETEPPGMRYQSWMLSELDRLGRAVA